MSELAATALADLTAEFIDSIGDPRVVPTARAYRDDLRQMIEMVAAEGVFTLVGLTRPVLGRWLRGLTARGYAAETIRRRVSARIARGIRTSRSCSRA